LKISLETLKEGSSDNELRFKMNLANALDSGTELLFRVTKKDKSGKNVESKEHRLPVTWDPILGPSITDVKRTGDTVVITGGHFYNTPKLELKVTLIPKGNSNAKEQPLDVKKVIPQQSGKLEITVARLEAACWTPRVEVGTNRVEGMKSFAEMGAVKITEVKKGTDGKTVTVTGTGLVEHQGCLNLFVRQSKTGTENVPVNGLKFESPDKAIFSHPTDPAEMKWIVVKSGENEIIDQIK
jgi:hypothetical protein